MLLLQLINIECRQSVLSRFGVKIESKYKKQLHGEINLFLPF